MSDDGTKVVNIGAVRDAKALTATERAELVEPSPEERYLLALAGAFDRVSGIAAIDATVTRVMKGSGR